MKSQEKKSLLIVIGVQYLTNFIEILAITGVGAAGALIAAKVTRQPVPEFASYFGFKNSNSFSPVIFFVTISTILLVLRTILSISINLAVNKKLALITNRVCDQTLVGLTRTKYQEIKRFSQADLVYYLGQGVNNDLKNILLGYYLIASESLFVGTILILLFCVSPALSTVLILLGVAFATILFKFTVKKIHKYGETEVELITRNNSLSSNFLSSYKELLISHKMTLFLNQMKASRSLENKNKALLQWHEQLPKFALELLLILTGVLLLAGASLPSNALWGSSAILIFSIALARISPALLRLQAGFSLLRFSATRFETTSEFLSGALSNYQTALEETSEGRNLQNSAVIKVTDLGFAFEDGRVLFSGISAEFAPGHPHCIVGRSGAGKSTFLELLMGLTSPTQGSVQINGISASIWNKSPDTSAYYLPQNVALIEGTLLQNVTLEHEVDNERRSLAVNSLRQVGLGHLLSDDESGLNSVVGLDLFLSGGERQRLGFARVLFSDSKIIYLDEPTSSLDENAESDVFELILELAKSRTVILVTHSLNAKRKFPNLISLS